jgi:hypothetical protein
VRDNRAFRDWRRQRLDARRVTDAGNAGGPEQRPREPAERSWCCTLNRGTSCGQDRETCIWNRGVSPRLATDRFAAGTGTGGLTPLDLVQPFRTSRSQVGAGGLPWSRASAHLVASVGLIFQGSTGSGSMSGLRGAREERRPGASGQRSAGLSRRYTARGSAVGRRRRSRVESASFTPIVASRVLWDGGATWDSVASLVRGARG